MVINPVEAFGGGPFGLSSGFRHFFGRNGVMHFVKAVDPAGPWSEPVALNCPSGMTFT